MISARLSTEGGLVHFDGQQFKVYNQSNRPGIGITRFMSIKKTRVKSSWWLMSGEETLSE
ncbi:MAG: hypothetical protein IPL22_07970 [Bacteroidetes bacterium]|nr:hypothetical protein [Bacteroidota bacterium]